MNLKEKLEEMLEEDNPIKNREVLKVDTATFENGRSVIIIDLDKLKKPIEEMVMTELLDLKKKIDIEIQSRIKELESFWKDE